MNDQELRDKLAHGYAPEYSAMNEAFVKTAFRAGWDAARANNLEQAELTAQNLQMASLLERAVVAAEALLEERDQLQRQLDLLNKDLDSTTECLVAEQKMREDAQVAAEKLAEALEEIESGRRIWEGSDVIARIALAEYREKFSKE